LSGVEDIQIQGNPINLNSIYTIATSNGFIEGINFIKSKFIFDTFKIENIVDTNRQNWEVLQNYVQQHSPLTSDIVPIGNRIKTIQPDLGVHWNDIDCKLVKTNPDNSINVTITAEIRNFGKSPSEDGIFANNPRILLLRNKNGTNYGVSPDYFEIGTSRSIRKLLPNESQLFKWDITLTKNEELIPITVKILSAPSEVNLTNNEATRIFSLSDILKGQ
jgi:hypothetical protein